VEPDSLLLIQPRWMGDVLLCTPAVRAARALPDARIDFLTEAAGAAVLDGNDDLDRVLMAAPAEHRLRMIQEVRRSRYDAIVDFRSTGSTAAVTRASGARVRVGLRGRGLRNLAYTDLLPKEKGPVYMARQKLALLQPLGIDVAGADVALRIEIGASDRARAAEIWRACGFDDDTPVVAVSAVSRVATKQWGSRRWAAVADHVAGLGARVLLTSGPDERGEAAATASLMRSTAVWDYGTTTLRELAALYQRCRLWLGNDGGPKHIAAAAGIPTLTVFRSAIGAVWTEDDPTGRHVFLEPLRHRQENGGRAFRQAAGVPPPAEVPVEQVMECAAALLRRHQA
jgi:ADP-heptose:LPS heptosyltransferase